MTALQPITIQQTPQLPRVSLLQLYAAYLNGTINRRAFVYGASEIGSATGAMALLACNIAPAA